MNDKSDVDKTTFSSQYSDTKICPKGTKDYYNILPIQMTGQPIGVIFSRLISKNR